MPCTRPQVRKRDAFDDVPPLSQRVDLGDADQRKRFAISGPSFGKDGWCTPSKGTRQQLTPILRLFADGDVGNLHDRGAGEVLDSLLGELSLLSLRKEAGDPQLMRHESKGERTKPDQCPTDGTNDTQTETDVNGMIGNSWCGACLLRHDGSWLGGATYETAAGCAAVRRLTTIRENTQGPVVETSLRCG